MSLEQNNQKSSDAEVNIEESRNSFTGCLDERRIGQYFRTGWRTFKQYPLGFMAFSLIVLIVRISLAFLANKIYLIGFLVEIAIYPLLLGDYIVSAKLLQKQSCKFSNFFCTFHYYRSLILYTSIAEIIYYIQYLAHNYWALRLLCGLAIIVLSVLFLFVPLIIVDRRPGFLQALRLSRQTVQGQLSGILVFGFYMFLILIVPSIALFWGIHSLTTISVALPLISFGAMAIVILQPIVSCAITAAYANLLGLESKEY